MHLCNMKKDKPILFAAAVAFSTGSSSVRCNVFFTLGKTILNCTSYQILYKQKV